VRVHVFVCLCVRVRACVRAYVRVYVCLCFTRCASCHPDVYQSLHVMLHGWVHSLSNITLLRCVLPKGSVGCHDQVAQVHLCSLRALGGGRNDERVRAD